MRDGQKKKDKRLVKGIKNSKAGEWSQKKHASLLRFWSLRVMPFLNRLVLPGCSGVPLMEILKNFSNRELWQSSKSLAFSFLMAMPPLLIFFFTLIPFLPIQGLQRELLFQLYMILPHGIFEHVANIINNFMIHKHSSLLSIGFVASVILAANGMHGLLQSFNSVNHSIEWRSFAHRYLLCLVLVVILYVLVVAILSLFIGYKLFIRFMLSNNYMAPTTLSFFAFSLGRWIILSILTLFTLSLLYYLAPVKKQRINFLSFGSVLSTLLIFGLSWAFQVYLNNFNNYNVLYGSIGTLLIVMLWVYANCIVILAGYAVNIAIADAREERYVPSRRNRKTRKRRFGLRSCYRLRTEDPQCRQPMGSNIYHSPSGISKWNRVVPSDKTINSESTSNK
ncbi:MAG: YihY/virulence factor BrkB family protein [Bacteroidales bacterium]|nr:YihY/virulence factor BrkB family protein [Bacteroidales bacterium]